MSEEEFYNLMQAYRTAPTTDQVTKERDELRKALHISANQLEGVSLAIKTHGQNISVPFFIETYKEFADKARETLTKFGGSSAD